MNSEQELILFGTKSPLAIEYEETIQRRGFTLLAGVSLGGRSRLQARGKVISLDVCRAEFTGAAFLPCAFATGNRQWLTDAAIDAGLVPHDGLLDPTVVIASSSRVGSGSYINAGVVIGGLSVLGAFALVNRSVNIGHHCILSDYVSIGPGATLASNVRVGSAATIGAGSVILPDVQIGENAIVAAGAVVRRHVAPGAVVTGNPARAVRVNPAHSKVRHNDQE